MAAAFGGGLLIRQVFGGMVRNGWYVTPSFFFSGRMWKMILLLVKRERKLVLDTSHPLSIDPAELWRISITNEVVLVTCVHSKHDSPWPFKMADFSRKFMSQQKNRAESVEEDNRL